MQSLVQCIAEPNSEADDDETAPNEDKTRADCVQVSMTLSLPSHCPLLPSHYPLITLS